MGDEDEARAAALRAANDAAVKATRRVHRLANFELALWSVPALLGVLAVLIVCGGCGWAIFTT